MVGPFPDGTIDFIGFIRNNKHRFLLVTLVQCLNDLRAAELVDVPDDVILKMYDKLRPNRSTKLELVMMAKELVEKYNAKNCARLVMEAAEVYEKRGILP